MSNDTLPEIRFPEFTDEWEQVKLKDVATVFDGTHQTPKYTESGVKFVSVENIKTLETEKYISQEAYDSEYSKKQAEKGDVLMTRIGDIGTAKVIETDEPLAYYVTLALLKPNEIDSSFLAWLISSPEVQRNIWKRTLHIAFPKKINLGEINQIEMNVPSLEEQTKIGTFFKQIDNTITLHQRKLDLLKETKKGFLQKMFPKNGAKVPEIRFPGFTEDWEERKLGGIGKTYTGLTGKSKEDFGHGDAKFVTYMNVFQNPKATLEQLENVEIDPRQNEVKKGDVFFTTSSETPEEVGMSSVWTHDINNIYLNSFTFAYRPTIKFDLDYLAFMLRSQSVRKKIIYLAQGISRYNISKTKMMDISVPIPVNFEEQQKIGAFFKQLDDTIALHQRKLDLLKETKKGFLQKMFV
ncbi:restriction endonuclease subunit S [Enterococcus hirae]|uniref:restriction endonuclease subunit S n=1 Tax=Enterococcus hirae TaxID=1354 RepID=UPI002DBBA60E|nr:restriction endonuclease subunit S [Enterococcus hirae]MEB7737633.1 restriction endonuclease subunit S [Enterococcus hirae]